MEGLSTPDKKALDTTSVVIRREKTGDTGYGRKLLPDTEKGETLCLE